MNGETAENKDWQQMKERYLKQVESALKGQTNIEEILNDVRSHLDRRYSELSEEQRTWENFQKIITEMGPPSDYAELIGSPAKNSGSAISAKYIAILVVVLVIAAAGLIILPNLLKKQQPVIEPVTIKQPFVNDSNLLGKWQSVDFVGDINDFTAGEQHWPGDLYLKQMIFFENGRTAGPWSWTNGEIYHPGDRTIAHYTIKEMAGSTYMFFEWMSGDVTIRHMKPKYYVLKKVPGTSPTQQAGEQNGNHTVVTKAAIETAQNWLKLVDNGQYSESWIQASEYFKGIVNQQQWMNSMETLRKPLGKVLSRYITSLPNYMTSLPGAPDGQYVVIQFQTSFENKQNAVETVTPMMDSDGKWHVSGYYIK